MAKELPADTIMPANKMKPLLMLSKKEPVQAAICLSSDGDGLVLLDKKAKPRKVAAMLKAAAGKAKLQLNASSVRFGRAEVDPEYDTGTVRFFVNKETPGAMRAKLIENVKRASFQKVEINVDESLEDEPEDDAAQESPQAGPEGAATAEAPALDADTLRRELVPLIGRIAAAAGDDAGRKAQLAGLAQAAGAACKGADLEAAVQAVARLREALEAPPDGAVAAQPAQGVGSGIDGFRDAWRKAWDGWLDAMDAVDAQLDMFARALRTENDPGLDEVAAALPTLLEGHKPRLNGIGLRLAGIGEAGLPKAAAEARAAITGFVSFLGQSAKVAACDGADVGVAVSIRSTLAPALERLAAALPEDQALPKAA